MSILRVEQDGVEFFTHEADGACEMSESGMARLCDVKQQSMNEKIQAALTGKLDSECLKEFIGRDIRSQVTLVVDGLPMNVNLYPSDFCAAMIEHYAFESRNKTKAALRAYRKFAKKGIEAWIQSITGWKAPELTAELVEKYINDRLPENLIAASVEVDGVIEIIQKSGFSATGLRIYFYLEMQMLKGQQPDIDQICQDLNIAPSTLKKWLPKIQTWSGVAKWLKLPTRQGPERKIQLRLHKELGGEMEVYTPIGPVDLVTKTEIIEIKRVEDWKTALGQVIAKAQTFPKQAKRIHLFGESSRQLKKITNHCQVLDVMVTFEKVVLEGDSVAA